jgi:hypothetical protein
MTLLRCLPMARRRYIARGVQGGYRIWDNWARRWWGDLYELCPDELLDKLNGARDYQKITVLLRKSRAQKR